MPMVCTPYFVPGSPHAILIEPRQALISYQDNRILLLTLAGEYMLQLGHREKQSGVAAIYAVQSSSDNDELSAELTESSCRKLLFHGSRAVNLISILKNGLRPKPDGVYHTGSLFGDGIYFADQYSKSHAYTAYHGHVGFMLLCDVECGRSLKLAQPQPSVDLTARPEQNPRPALCGAHS